VHINPDPGNKLQDICAGAMICATFQHTTPLPAFPKQLQVITLGGKSLPAVYPTSSIKDFPLDRRNETVSTKNEPFMYVLDEYRK
jgi:hypothetical protein